MTREQEQQVAPGARVLYQGWLEMVVVRVSYRLTFRVALEQIVEA